VCACVCVCVSVIMLGTKMLQWEQPAAVKAMMAPDVCACACVCACVCVCVCACMCVCVPIDLCNLLVGGMQL
jgi:hypothetical protein